MAESIREAVEALTLACGNEDCDRCDPRPRWKVSTERVARRRHEREIKAATADDALAIYLTGTEWPSSYDERDVAVLEQMLPNVEPTTREFMDLDCWHNLESERSKWIQSADGDSLDPIREPVSDNVLDIPDDDLVPQLSRQIQTMFAEMTRVEKYAMLLHASLADLVAILERNGGHLWPWEQDAITVAKRLLKGDGR